jgi:hypothetical protein
LRSISVQTQDGLCGLCCKSIFLLLLDGHLLILWSLAIETVFDKRTEVGESLDGCKVLIGEALCVLQWILGGERLEEGVESMIEVMFEVVEVCVEIFLQALSDGGVLVVIVKF